MSGGDRGRRLSGADRGRRLSGADRGRRLSGADRGRRLSGADRGSPPLIHPVPRVHTPLFLPLALPPLFLILLPPSHSRSPSLPPSLLPLNLPPSPSPSPPPPPSPSPSLSLSLSLRLPLRGEWLGPATSARREQLGGRGGHAARQGPALLQGHTRRG